MQDFFRHPYMKRLLSLNLCADEYVVAGSAPLMIRGLLKSISDLDVVATREAWEAVVQNHTPTAAPFGPVEHIVMFKGTLEILDGWFPEIWTTEDIIDSADQFEGINFANLAIVRRSKELLGRPVDLQHLAILDEYVARGGT